MTQPLTVPRPASTTGLPFILLAALLWGTIAITVAAIYRLAPLDPIRVGFYRVVFAAPALLLLMVLTGQYRGVRLSRPFLNQAGLMGLAIASDQVCNFTAIQTVGVSIASLVSLCTAPLLVAVFGALVLRESFPPRLYGLLGTALLGTALLVYRPVGLDGPHPLLGIAWAFGSALSYATILLCSRTLSTLAPPLVSLATSFSIAALLLLPVAAHQGVSLQVSWRVWGLLAYLGIVATGVGYLLFLLGMRHTSATIASVATLLEPFLAVVLAILFFGEHLTSLGFLGGGILLLSLGFLPVMLNQGVKHHGHPLETDR
ncbi:DMT family transporter [Deinococcus ruber]|uniref:Membrane protein n=1 Tax=Deinococcus ruber TaxID=1848197 RepID=A0A918FDT0_9DEIO|nr:DMT family transporter [Deinococcus ruber]GGR30802.1 membrane protein [Deinococcus ruber]